MSTINNKEEFENGQIFDDMNETSKFNIPVIDINVRDEKDSEINDTIYSLEFNKCEVLSALNPKQNFKTYPTFINKLKECNVSNIFRNLRNFYRKIRILVNLASILFCLTLCLCFILKLVIYKNQIKPTGFDVKNINFSFSKSNMFILKIKGIPLTEKNETFHISNMALSINPLNTKKCWYKFTSDSIKTICTNTNETEMCFKGAINPTHSLSKIFNEIKFKGCSIILQVKIRVTNFWVFKSTYTLTKEQPFKMNSIQKSDLGNDLFYILNKSLRGEKILFSDIRPEHLNIFDFSILSDRKIKTGVVTPNMYFSGLKALTFDLKNLGFIYKRTKANEGRCEIKKIVLNNLNMINGKLLPVKLISDDFLNCHKLSIENLYLKLWDESEEIRLLNVSISSFSLFEGDICLKQKLEDEKKKEFEGVNIINIKEISSDNISFTFSFLKMRSSAFIEHIGFCGDKGVLKVMTLDEQPLLLFTINYIFQTENNLKNSQMEVIMSDINWQLTFKGLNNGEEVQIIDSYNQYISPFSFETCSFIKEGMRNKVNKKGNEYKINSYIQNINPSSFEISFIANALMKNEKYVKKEIQIKFLNDTEIKLTNDQFNITYSLEKQNLVKHIDSNSFDKDLRFKISVFPKTDFVGFTKYDDLFLFKLPNGEKINFQTLSFKVMKGKDVISLFNHLSMDYSETNVTVNIKETKNINDSLKISENSSSVHWMLYFPTNYEIYMPREMTIIGLKLKSPNFIHICFNSKRILFKTCSLPISFENSIIEYKSDAFKDTLFILLNTYLYESELIDSLKRKEPIMTSEEVDNLINQEMSSGREKQDLFNELSYISKKYYKLEEEIEYKVKPKIYFKFYEKEMNSVFGITVTLESISNINTLLKEIKRSFFLLNSHEYFSKSFSENLYEKVFKKFVNHLTLLNNSISKKINFNIKSIEVNSKDGNRILKIYVPDYSFNPFELDKLEISIEVDLKGVSMFIKDDFLFEILVEDVESKKIKFINYDISKGIFISFLKHVKNKNSECSAINTNENACVNLNADIMDNILFVLKPAVSFLQQINNSLFFVNLLHNECEIYVELLYENVFKFILFKQEERKQPIKMEVIKNNLVVLIARLLSESLFYYKYFKSSNENTNSNNVWTFLISVFYQVFEFSIDESYWDIARTISSIETISTEYEAYRNINIKQSFNEFKTEIIFGTLLTEPNYETKKCFSVVYQNIILSFYMNFQTNVLKNINITFEVSTEPLQHEKFDNNYIYKVLLSLYKKLYMKLKIDKRYTEDNKEINVNIAQILEFCKSLNRNIWPFCFKKPKDIAIKISSICCSVAKQCHNASKQFFYAFVQCFNVRYYNS